MNGWPLNSELWCRCKVCKQGWNMHDKKYNRHPYITRTCSLQLHDLGTWLCWQVWFVHVCVCVMKGCLLYLLSSIFHPCLHISWHCHPYTSFCSYYNFILVDVFFFQILDSRHHDLIHRWAIYTCTVLYMLSVLAMHMTNMGLANHAYKTRYQGMWWLSLILMHASLHANNTDAMT